MEFGSVIDSFTLTSFINFIFYYFFFLETVKDLDGKPKLQTEANVGVSKCN